MEAATGAYATLIQAWRGILKDPRMPWVLFENGTCVLLREPQADVAAQAIALLQEWGPVHVATPSADFNVIHLQGNAGDVVTCHHPDILAYVGRGEAGPLAAEVVIGLLGRAKRARDAEGLHIVHIEHASSN